MKSSEVSSSFVPFQFQAHEEMNTLSYVTNMPSHHQESMASPREMGTKFKATTEADLDQVKT